MSTPFYSNVTAGAQACSRPRFTQPFAGDNGAYVLEQDFQQNTLLSAYTPLPLNTAHATFPAYVLTMEGTLQDLGGGEIRWTRTYCQTPATRNDYASIVYKFIGYLGAANLSLSAPATLNYPGRLPFTDTVTCRLQNDYFLVGPGGSYATADAIPTNAKQQYYIPQGYWSGGTFVNYYVDPVVAALEGIAISQLWDTTGPFAAFGLGIACVPSRSTYQGWVAAGTDIVAENSQLSRWKGNLFCRVTKYVTAI